MENIKTIEKIFQYIEQENFLRIEPAGLLQSRRSYGKFNPSAGHHIVDPILAENEPCELKRFSILERCLREADSSRIGLSNRHLSFFEMFAFHVYGKYDELPKKETTIKYYNLLTKNLNLDKDRLLVTVLGKCNFENQHLDESETEEIYKAWTGLIGKDKVKRTTGRRNLFIAKIPGAAGGTGFEVYYKMVSGNYIEIGSQVAYHYIYRGPINMHKTVNGTLGNGIGIERLLMAIENKETIYDISLIRPIKDAVIRKLNDGTEELYEDNINIIVDHIRTIIFVIFEKEKQSLELTDSQKKILRSFKKDLESQLNYLGINREIYEELINCVINLYKDRYPDLSGKKDKIIEFLQT